MNSIKQRMSSNLQSFIITMGSLSVYRFVNMESKNVLHAHKTTRCARSVRPSHANVTSQNASRSNNCENMVCKLLWWYFHRRQYCCIVILSALTVRRNQRLDKKTKRKETKAKTFQLKSSHHDFFLALINKMNQIKNRKHTYVSVSTVSCSEERHTRKKSATE